MKLAYIAGPYRAKTEYEVHRNIQLAEQAAAHAWQKGYAVICPHKNTAYMGGMVPDQAILDGDLAMLRKCDVVILCGKWYASQGACAEAAEAMRWGLAIYEYRTELGGALLMVEPADVSRRMARHDYGCKRTPPGSSVQVSDAAYEDGDGSVFGGRTNNVDVVV